MNKVKGIDLHLNEFISDSLYEYKLPEIDDIFSDESFELFRKLLRIEFSKKLFEDYNQHNNDGLTVEDCLQNPYIVHSYLRHIEDDITDMVTEFYRKDIQVYELIQNIIDSVYDDTLRGNHGIYMTTMTMLFAINVYTQIDTNNNSRDVKLLKEMQKHMLISAKRYWDHQNHDITRFNRELFVMCMYYMNKYVDSHRYVPYRFLNISLVTVCMNKTKPWWMIKDEYKKLNIFKRLYRKIKQIL